MTHQSIDTPALDLLPGSLEAALSAVVELVRGSCRGVVGVQLAGSLARGEAMIALSDSGWTIENDVDLVALVESPIDSAALNGVAAEAARLLCCDTVDLGVWTRTTAATATPSVLSVDLRLASRPLWGEDLRGILPESISASALPPREALELSFNRLHCLLEAHPCRSRSGSYQRRQLTKAIEGVVESTLILRQGYDPSYAEKAARFGSLGEVEASYVRASEWALANRAAANRSVLEAPPWSIVRDATLWALTNALTASTGKRASGWRRIAARVVFREIGASLVHGSLRVLPARAWRAGRRGASSASQLLVAASAAPSRTSAVRTAGLALGHPWGSFEATLERSLHAWFRTHHRS